ncbi:MAG: hypothetical protein ACRC7B_02565 [Metamycoplasmataceae bacterium]
MNKKILLGIGATLLTALPLAAIVSCTQSTTNPNIIIDTQAKLFNNPITTSNPHVDPQLVVDTINEAASSQEKLTVVRVYANVPTLSDGFELEVISAAVRERETSKEAVDVSIRIVETANINIFREVILKIEGFQSINLIESDIYTEAAKFDVATTKLHNTSAIKVVNNINSVEGEQNKLYSLSLIVDLPTLTYGYSFKVISANINLTDKSVVDVIISVFHVNKPSDSTETTYEIRGFKISDLVTEASKFVNTRTSSKFSALEIVDKIQFAPSPEGKILLLSNVSTLPKLEDGFSFQIEWVIEDESNNSLIWVIISVSKDDSIETPKTVVYSIDGFESSTPEIEREKFNDPITTTKPEIDLDLLLNQIMAVGNSNDQKLLIIKEFANLPSLAYGFELEIISVQKSGLDSLEIDARIRKQNTSNISESFKIIVSGFDVRDLNLELSEEIAKFNNPVQTKAPSLYSTQIANSINSKLTDSDKYYELLLISDVPTLKDGFGMVVQSASAVGVDALSVIIKIFNINNPSIESDVTFEIYGFRTKSLETEANKFVNIGTKTPDRVSNKVVELILESNDIQRKAMLNEIMDVPILEGDNGFVFDFVVEWAMVDSTNPANIIVTVSIFEITTPDIKRTTTFTIGGFKVSTLADEALKFNSAITKDTTLSVIEAVTNITNAQSPEAKTAALTAFVNVPVLAEGFTFEVESANINAAFGTAIDVLIILREVGTSNSTQIHYLVNGLRNSTVDIEAKKFLNPIPHTNRDSSISTEEWASRITLANNQENKLDVLNNLLRVFNQSGSVIGTLIPELSDGFSFEILGATNKVGGESTRSVIVDIVVIDNQTDQRQNTWLTITGFNKATDTPLEKEAKKFNIILDTIQPTLSIDQAKDKFKTGNAIANNAALIELISEQNIPQISDLFTFEVFGIDLDASSLEALKIIIIVRNASDGTAQNTLLTIKGFLN